MNGVEVSSTAALEARRQYAIHLYEERGWGMLRIARAVGACKGTVRRWLTEEGKIGKPKPRTLTMNTADDHASNPAPGACRFAVANAKDRGQSHVVAANRLVRHFEQRADLWHEEDGPLWHGWAIHAGFLAGVAWERARQERRADERTDG